MNLSNYSLDDLREIESVLSLVLYNIDQINKKNFQDKIIRIYSDLTELKISTNSKLKNTVDSWLLEIHKLLNVNSFKEIELIFSEIKNEILKTKKEIETKIKKLLSKSTKESSIQDFEYYESPWFLQEISFSLYDVVSYLNTLLDEKVFNDEIQRNEIFQKVVNVLSNIEDKFYTGDPFKNTISTWINEIKDLSKKENFNEARSRIKSLRNTIEFNSDHFEDLAEKAQKELEKIHEEEKKQFFSEDDIESFLLKSFR